MQTYGRTERFNIRSPGLRTSLQTV